ncbi:MAG: T9SS type A sorting domain-containing protein [Bacteroidota bacterium]
MRSLKLILLLAVITLNTFGQGHLLPNTFINPSTPTSYTGQDMLVFDRLGNQFRWSDLLFKKPVSGGSTSNSCTAGIFRLHFEDDGTGAGFDDPDYAQAKAMVCQVYTDISLLINEANSPYSTIPDLGNGNYVEIDVKKSLNNPSNGILGICDQFYYQTSPGIVHGTVWQTINSGIDSWFGTGLSGNSSVGIYHGYLQLNFGYNYYYGANPNLIPANEYDFYSTVIHEALHAIGLSSLIAEDGSSKIASGIYSKYDTFLKETNGGKEIISRSGCYDYNFNVSATDLITPCSILFTGTNNIYVTSPSSWSNANSLSHFDLNCGAGNYVLSPTILKGSSNRNYDIAELTSLCDLGYSISGIWGNSTYPASGTCGSRVAGVNDYGKYTSSAPGAAFTTPINTNLSIDASDILNNDENATFFDCLTPLNNCGTVSITSGGIGSKINFIPANNFNGYAFLKYIPYDVQNGKPGNITYIILQVIPPQAPCNVPACEMVCYGDFEGFIDQVEYDNYTQGGAGTVPSNTFLWLQPFTTDNTPDFRNTPVTSQFYSPCPGTFVTVNAHSGNNFVGMVVRTVGGTNWPEGPSLELNQPLLPGETATVTVWARLNSTNCMGAIEARFTDVQPCYFPDDINSCAPPLVMSPILGPISLTGNTAIWQQLSFTYTNTTGTPFTFLLLNSWATTANPNYYHIWIDDVSCIKNTPVVVTKTGPSTACTGDTVHYTIEVCNNTGGTADNVSLSDILPAGLTPIGGTFTLPTQTVGTLTAGACLTYTINAIVTATSGNISNIVNATSGTCLPFTTADTTSLTVSPCNAPFVITKTSSVPCTYAGHPVTFTITITNNTGSQQSVTVTDIFPNYFVIASANPDPCFPLPPCSIFPDNTPTTINVNPGNNIYTVTGYYTQIGTCPDSNFTNYVSMDALGTTYTADVCVCIRRGCPMYVFGTSDCIVGNDVMLNSNIHTGQIGVTRVEYSIIYPVFLSPPAILDQTTLIPQGNQPIDYANSSFTGAPSFAYTFLGVDYWIVPLKISFLPAINLPPYGTFGSIKFNYTNNPPRPLGQNSFLCAISSPLGGANHIDIYTVAGGNTPVTLWTQGYHITFIGCPDVGFRDASFTLSQTPCDNSGTVAVTANYNSPTAVHIWDFGDGRSTPVNGTPNEDWEYLDDYVDMNGYTQPGFPGTYTIKHTVEENGISTIETMNVTVSPGCCSADFIIKDGESVSSIGQTNLSGTVSIQGKFVIDQTFGFQNATVTMEPGAEIIVTAGSVFNTDQTSISACSDMWRGVTIEPEGIVKFTNSSIADAQYAFYVNDKSYCYVDNSVFERNYVGIFTPQSPIDYNSLGLYVSQSTFKTGSGLANPFTGQTPAPSTKSFAGMYLHDITLDLSNPGFNPNYFEDMSNGIVGGRIELDATNCIFKDIRPDAAYKSYTAFNGSAIYDRGGHGYFGIRQIGLGQNSAISTFSNCYYGITGQNVSVVSSKNKMTNMEMGYRVEYGSYMNIVITDNYLESKRNGIDLRYNDNSEKLLVKNNEIHFGHPLISNSKGDIAINMIEKNGSNNSSAILNNEIYFTSMCTNARIGIMLNSVSKCRVNENHLVMTNNIDNLYGIYSFGSEFPEISCNLITGSNNNYTNKYQSAIKITLNSKPVISCNNVNGTYNGIYFSGASYSADVKGNVFNDHVFGLHLDNYAILGTQDFRGNLWYTAALNGGLNATYDNIFNAQQYTWAVDPTIIYPGSNPVPMTSSPSGWINPGSGTNFTCVRQGRSYCGQSIYIDEEQALLDEQIATGNLQGNPFEQETKWILEKELYAKLDNDPSLMLNEQELSDFYNSAQSQLYDQLKDIKEVHDNLFTLDPLVSTNLAQNAHLLEASMKQLNENTKQLVDGGLSAAQVLTLKTTILALQQNITTMLTYNKTSLDLAFNTRVLEADNTAIINSGLSTSAVIAENEIIMNEIYLETIAKGITTFSNDMIEKILSIAQQCPIAGGPAVALARGMYEMIDETMEYDDASICLQGGILLRHTGDEIMSRAIQTNAPYFIPNPARQNATLYYKFDKSIDGMLVITNNLGQIEMQQHLNADENAASVSTSTLGNGVYYFKLISNGFETGNGKLVVIK